MVLESPEDLERALEARPELRDRLLAAAGGGEDGDAAGGNGQDPLLALLQPWIQTPSWTESYRFLLAHPELLSEEAEAALAGLLERATAAGNANAIGAFSEHLALLRRSREAGTQAAYAEKMEITPQRFDQAVEATAAEAQLPPGARQAFEEVLAALVAEGVSVNSPEELQAALDARPELQQKLAAALGGGDDAGPDIPTKFREDIRQAKTAEQRYRATGDRAALDEAAAAWERVLGHPEFRAADERFQLACLNGAGGVYLRRYWAGGRLANLDRALALWQDAVRRTPADSPDRAMFQNNLGNGLRDRYARTGAAGRPGRGHRRLRGRGAARPADSPDRAVHLEQPGQRAARPLRAHGAAGRPGAGHRRLRGRGAAHRRPTRPTGPLFLNNLGNGLQRPLRPHGAAGATWSAAIAAYEDAVRRTAGRLARPGLAPEQPGQRAARPLRAHGAAGRPGRGHRRL